VSAPAGSDLRPGELVTHWHGWRDYAFVTAAECERVSADADPSVHLGHGWTAYAALTQAVRLRPGDTVFVSAASSAIGTMAGQLARLLGAGRVIGSTGSAAKAERLRDLGYDAVLRRDAGSLADQLRAAAPDGIDACLDLAGGEALRAAVDNAREGARIAIVGALSGQLAAAGNGSAAPVTLDSLRLLLKKVVLRGFSADDVDGLVRDEWQRRSRDWLRTGELSFPHVRIAGLDRAPEALRDLIRGRYLGTVLIEPVIES
jgi:2-alkenal reductase